MSKSHESRGRGGLRRHIGMKPARAGSGRSHYTPKGDTQGAFGRFVRPPETERLPRDPAGEEQVTDDVLAQFCRYRWPETNGQPACPKCRSVAHYRYGTRNLFKCKQCDQRFTTVSGTALQGCKLPLWKILAAIKLTDNGARECNVSELSRIISVGWDTAHELTNKLRSSWGGGESNWAAGLPKSESRRGFVKLVDLKEAVLRPGIETHLRPLMLYRGRHSIGRIKMLWNHLQLMHLAGARTIPEAVKLHQDEEVAQLLGPHKRLQNASLYGFLSRMMDNIHIAENIPGLPDYLRNELQFRKFNLQRISAACPNSKIPWRREAGQKVAAEAAHKRHIERERAKHDDASRLFYPYMIHDPENDEADLVAFINSVVPRGLISDLRADVCQEMLLAILTGEISRDQAHDKRHEMIRRVMVMNGFSERSCYLSETLPGHSKTIGELLVDSEWLNPEEELIEREEWAA